jgi:hypothetical protein
VPEAVTEPERKVARRIVDAGRREFMEEQGGYDVVEKDARNQELLLDRRCKRGRRTYAELDAENAELRRLLHLAYNRVSAARKSRDVWYMRATGHQPGDGRGGSRRKKNAIVNSQSTSQVG